MSRGLIDKTLAKLVDNSPKEGNGSIQIGGTLIQWGYTTTNSNGYALPYFGKTFSNTPRVYATSSYVSGTVVLVCSAQPYTDRTVIYARTVTGALPASGCGIYWLAIGDA